jgi:hypothetical protein
MSRVRAFTTPAGLALLLSAVMVGVTGALSTSSPSAAACTWTLTVPAAVFHPEDDGYHFYNSGWMLTSDDDNTNRYFTAHVPFPCTGEVTVEKVEFMGYDNNPLYEMCFGLLRLDPLAPQRTGMGGVSSGVEFASSTIPETWTITEFDPATTDASQAACLWLQMADNDDLHLYGIKIAYRGYECCFLPPGMRE